MATLESSSINQSDFYTYKVIFIKYILKLPNCNRIFTNYETVTKFSVTCN